MRKQLTISSCEVPQFPRQICDRSEHASDNDIALDLGKPQLGLIQLGGVGRREVKPDFQILLQKLLHRLGLMGRQIVQDDVDLTTEARKAPRQTSVVYNAAWLGFQNGNPRLPRYSTE